MNYTLDDLILFFTVFIGLALYMYIIRDIYKQDFKDEWSRTIFLAGVMLLPIAGMVIYAIFSRRFINK